MLFLDMDGVLMNYEGQIAAHGVPRYREGAHWITQPRETWPQGMLDADVAYCQTMEHPEFWSGIQPMDDAHLLWQYCAPLKPQVLTAAPTDRPGETRFSLIRERIAQDKRASIWTHFDPEFPVEHIHVCLRHEKAQFARIGATLVDDTPGNCREWEEAGGIAILHTDALSTIRKLQEVYHG